MKFHGIAGSECSDKQGETLLVDGADISSLALGGKVNDNHQAGFFNTLGSVNYAKKLRSKEDATTPEEKYFWEKTKVPCIYIQGELFDDEDHPNAKAAAAVLRSYYKNKNSPIQVKASVEGKTVQRNSKTGLLEKTFISAVALTLTPVNSNTLIEPYGLQKSEADDTQWLHLAKSLIISGPIPSFIEVGSSLAIIDSLQTLKKAITASSFPNVVCPYCGDTNTIFSLYQKSCNKCERNFSFKEVKKILEKLG